ncbi:hypothetical protein B0I35DRAFT_436162 [Stachybotrys elegans]|uniref:Rhodopsin domain-containing protein n=1 Tax=Stachybotrys elegans TaxID=80388 RepID=A0A8K0SSJ3_9HYPO|nr:hypothetical protein B0I35DRAFT_436162 [Stachybotrys elegans]
MWNIRATDMPRILYLFSYVPLLYAKSMGLAKYFLCVQLKRIFCQAVRGPVWWALQMTIVINTLFYAIIFIIFLCQCIPREKIWDNTFDGVCIDYAASFVACRAINLVLDIGILAVPIWAVWHLQMTFKHKIKPLLLFAIVLDLRDSHRFHGLSISHYHWR